MGTHPEFKNRFRFIDVGKKDGDEDGHGTHVAGIVGGEKTSLAPLVNVVGVRTLVGNQGTMADLVEAMAGVMKDIKSKKITKSVLNMSLTGYNTGEKMSNPGIKELVKAGCVVVVAAGNQSDDACDYEPAASPDAITVGAIDEKDELAQFSNIGKCVDVFAPGVRIKSSTKNGQYDEMSGTSMASPVIASVAAAYLGAGLSPEETRQAIVKGCTKGAIPQLGNGSPNCIGYLSPDGKSPADSKTPPKDGNKGEDPSQPPKDDDDDKKSRPPKPPGELPKDREGEEGEDPAEPPKKSPCPGNPTPNPPRYPDSPDEDSKNPRYENPPPKDHDEEREAPPKPPCPDESKPKDPPKKTPCPDHPGEEKKNPRYGVPDSTPPNGSDESEKETPPEEDRHKDATQPPCTKTK
jgi:hypothetical protein